MRVPRRGLGRLFVSLSLLAGLAGPNAASAAPPEGCVGFPSIPEAFICITQWSPTNAVPSVSQGPGQTFVIPEFCAFECVGPTPVTVPNVVVTQGSGVVAVVTYDGATYPVTVPPAGSPGETVAQAQRAIGNALTTALTIAGGAKQQAETVLANAQNTPLPHGGAVALEATADIWCHGCGVSNGTFDARVTGAAGRPLAASAATASYVMYSPVGPTCLVTATASGTIQGALNVSFNWSMLGGLAVMSTTGDIDGAGVSTFAVTSPVGIPCGGPVTAMMTAVIFGT